MKKTLLVLGLFLTINQVYALTVTNSFEMVNTASISKQDISEIVERFKYTKVNGRKFDIKDVQDYFDDINPGDYKTYWKKMDKFESDYGNSPISKILFQVAMGDHNIKKYEKRFKLTIARDDQVRFEDYRFIEERFRGSPPSYIDRGFENACVVSFRDGESDTECEHIKGSSGLLGLTIFIATAGNLGSTNGARREKTICDTQKSINVLVRSQNEDGSFSLQHAAYVARGTSIVYDTNVWFRGDMKDQSHRRAQFEHSSAEDKLQQYGCERHRPWDGVVSTLELQRPDAHQPNAQDPEPQDLDQDDIIDPSQEPIIENSSRDESNPDDSNESPLIEAPAVFAR